MADVIPLDPRVNPSYLKLDLYCRGLRLDESCHVTDDGGRPLLRTRAGLGSGLELVLPGDLWVNVPVLESFAEASPYLLRRQPDGEYVLEHDGDACLPVRLADQPAWYERRTAAGRPMRQVGTLQGTYLGVYPAQVCEFWRKGPERPEKENCRFCSVGLNLGADDADGKSVAEVVEVAKAAQRESDVTYVDFNTGHQDDLGFLDAVEPYVRAVKRSTGLLVGVQSPPHPDVGRYERLRAEGVNRVSFCFEIFDRELFQEICPGKDRVYGLSGYLDTIESCVEIARRRRGSFLEPWVVNGEIIAGLEPPSSSIAAIEWLTSRGAIPTVCVFRPLRGTDMSRRPPPRTEDLVPVFEALHVRCHEAGLPIGVAPNVHVSLVLLPEECRGLVQDPAALGRCDRAERRLAWQRRAFRAAWRTRRLLHAIA